jgi:hypothetical protein
MQPTFIIFPFMTGTIAQVVSLASYGNEYFQSGVPPTHYFPDNFIFQHCNTVDFREPGKQITADPAAERTIETIKADNPVQWFDLLQKDGCKKIRLYFFSSTNPGPVADHKLAGMVGGGGTWLIETLFDGYSDYWSNRWTVTQKENPDNKIWSVNYGRTFIRRPVSNLQIDIWQSHTLLAIVLAEITGFALLKGLGEWAEIFQKAIAVLSSPSPGTGYYYKDFFVEKNYSLPARQNLFAAGTAWVFGGMGSWNDLYFETETDNQQYERVSAKLFAAINQAILATINSF